MNEINKPLERELVNVNITLTEEQLRLVKNCLHLCVSKPVNFITVEEYNSILNRLN